MRIKLLFATLGLLIARTAGIATREAFKDDNPRNPSNDNLRSLDEEEVSYLNVEKFGEPDSDGNQRYKVGLDFDSLDFDQGDYELDINGQKILLTAPDDADPTGLIDLEELLTHGNTLSNSDSIEQTEMCFLNPPFGSKCLPENTGFVGAINNGYFDHAVRFLESNPAAIFTPTNDAQRKILNELTSLEFSQLTALREALAKSENITPENKQLFQKKLIAHLHPNMPERIAIVSQGIRMAIWGGVNIVVALFLNCINKYPSPSAFLERVRAQTLAQGNMLYLEGMVRYYEHMPDYNPIIIDIFWVLASTFSSGILEKMLRNNFQKTDAELISISACAMLLRKSFLAKDNSAYLLLFSYFAASSLSNYILSQRLPKTVAITKEKPPLPDCRTQIAKAFEGLVNLHVVYKEEKNNNNNLVLTVTNPADSKEAASSEIIVITVKGTVYRVGKKEIVINIAKSLKSFMTCQVVKGKEIKITDISDADKIEANLTTAASAVADVFAKQKMADELVEQQRKNKEQETKALQVTLKDQPVSTASTPKPQEAKPSHPAKSTKTAWKKKQEKIAEAKAKEAEKLREKALIEAQQEQQRKQAWRAAQAEKAAMRKAAEDAAKRKAAEDAKLAQEARVAEQKQSVASAIAANSTIFSSKAPLVPLADPEHPNNMANKSHSELLAAAYRHNYCIRSIQTNFNSKEDPLKAASLKYLALFYHTLRHSLTFKYYAGTQKNEAAYLRHMMAHRGWLATCNDLSKTAKEFCLQFPIEPSEKDDDPKSLEKFLTRFKLVENIELWKLHTKKQLVLTDLEIYKSLDKVFNPTTESKDEQKEESAAIVIKNLFPDPEKQINEWIVMINAHAEQLLKIYPNHQAIKKAKDKDILALTEFYPLPIPALKTLLLWCGELSAHAINIPDQALLAFLGHCDKNHIRNRIAHELPDLEGVEDIKVILQACLFAKSVTLRKDCKDLHQTSFAQEFNQQNNDTEAKTLPVARM